MGLASQPRGLVRLEGLHALKHALRFGGVVVEARTSDLAGLLELANDVCPDLLDTLTALLVEVEASDLVDERGRRLPSPVVATAHAATWSLEDILARPDRPVVLLERPTHLGNLGACIRVAAAADAAGIIATGTVDPWHPSVVRGAAGLQFAVPVLSGFDTFEDLQSAAGMGDLLRNRRLVAVDPDGDVEAAVPAGAVLAFGSEREGLTEECKAQADVTLALPMRAGVSSLNLATSVAATLYRHAPPA